MPCTARAKRTKSIWEQLTEDEKKNEFELHTIQHDLVREVYPGQDAHTVIEKMTDAEYADFFKAVLARFRARRKRLSHYLRQEGKTAQADQVDAETEKAVAEAQQ